MAKETRYSAIGRRKSSVAKVTITPGKGVITVNGKDVSDYMPYETLVMDLVQPLELVDAREKFDVNVVVKGGGFSGQTGAIRLGITRALLEYDAPNADSEDNFRKKLKVAGFITRDSRSKERKKPGLKAARRAPQFSKR